MADRCVQCNPVISRFARLLLRISLQLTPEDLSNIKLILVVDGYLKQTKMESLQNAADLLRALWSRGLIQEENLSLISEILSQIQRRDCVRLIQEFIDSRPFQNVTALTLPKETTTDQTPKGGPEVELECDSDSNKVKLTKFLKKKLSYKEAAKKRQSYSSESGSLAKRESFAKSTLSSNSSDDEKMWEENLEISFEDILL